MTASPAPVRRSRLRDYALNLAISLGSTLAVLAFCEFVLFRTLLPGSDVPRNAYVDEVVRYAPGQRGVWRVRDEIAAPFAINAQGWNSPLPDYPLARREGVERIAFVGDSFVEALQVPVGESLAEKTAAALGRPSETLRFAVAGAPMSQYLQMVERGVERFRPETIVVLLVHNDFDESFLFRPGRYTSSFRKVRVEDGKVVGEIEPAPWRAGAFEWLRRTATARFFLYRWQVRPQLLVDALFAPARAQDFAANVDLGSLRAHEAEIRAVTDYLMRRIADRAKAVGARLLVAMDGDRQAIYAGRDSPALALNRIAAEAAERNGIRFLDLHPVFAADYAKRGRRFEFNSDAHWNALGHQVAGEAVAGVLATR